MDTASLATMIMAATTSALTSTPPPVATSAPSRCANAYPSFYTGTCHYSHSPCVCVRACVLACVWVHPHHRHRLCLMLHAGTAQLVRLLHALRRPAPAALRRQAVVRVPVGIRCVRGQGWRVRAPRWQTQPFGPHVSCCRCGNIQTIVCDATNMQALRAYEVQAAAGSAEAQRARACLAERCKISETVTFM